DDLAPEVGVGEPPVAEEQDGALAALEVVEGAAVELQREGLTQQLRAPAIRRAHAGCVLVSSPKTRSAKGVKIAAKPSGSLTCGAWPVSSSSSRAPGTVAAIVRPALSGITGSFLPQTTSVGARIEAASSRRS